MKDITRSPHRANRVLLALLGERLLPNEAETDDVTPQIPRRVAHG